jgi:hypothetical protein
MFFDEGIVKSSLQKELCSNSFQFFPHLFLSPHPQVLGQITASSEAR